MVKITRASKNDKGLTIRTSQLDKRIKFKTGDEFLVLFDNDVSILFKTTRNGDTLYSGAKAISNNKFKPKINKPVETLIKRIFRVTK